MKRYARRTPEQLKADALRFQTRTAWAKGSPGPYVTARKQGLLEECCGHMEEVKKPNGTWTPERIHAVALSYPTRAAWKKGSSGAYAAAKRQGIIEECCGHMEKTQIHRAPEQIKADALRFQTRAAWAKGSPGAYQSAHRRGILEECCVHMETPGKWSTERLQADALPYPTRSAWAKGSPAGYLAARKQGLLEECCGHMEVLQRPKGYWNPERCESNALQFQTRRAWAKGSPGAYGVACKLGILEECCGHMEEMRKPDGHWTPARIRSVALQYQTRIAWSKGSSGSYQSARAQGLLEECCGHMDDSWIGSDNDTVYFWKAEGTEFYKIGVTSERLGTQRIDRVAEASGFTPVVLAMTTINGKATDVETELLHEFNRSAGLEGFDGCTEFRHLASWEAAEVVSILATAGN